MTKKYFVLIFFIMILDAQAQEMKSENSELLLYSQFGEFCTMCEATLVCIDEKMKINDAFLDHESYLLIHLETRTFWSQITTIWEFFIRNFDGYQVKGHSRPAILYSSEMGNWFDIETTTAEISIDPNLIKIKQFVIDRETQDWIDHKEQKIGSCIRLPLWETLEYIVERVHKSENNE